jgi:hypothetical protein
MEGAPMPPKKKADPTPDEPTAANDAAAEAAATEPEVKPIEVLWRGITLTVPGDILNSARFRMAIRIGHIDGMVFEALGPIEATKLLETLKRGEDADATLLEFFTALRKAAGWGNLVASR